jgi:hypothetical protein
VNEAIAREGVDLDLGILKETTQKSEFLIKHIRENVQKDNTSMVNVLRTWASRHRIGG